MSTELQGDGRASGQVRSTLMTLVIERRDTHWKIIAAHNTNIVASARVATANVRHFERIPGLDVVVITMTE